MPERDLTRQMVAAYRAATLFAEQQKQSDKGMDWRAERERCCAIMEALAALPKPAAK